MSEGRQPRPAAYAGIELLASLDAEGWAAWLGGDPAEIARLAIAAAAGRSGLPVDLETELGLLLTDDAAVRALNAEWRGQDKPTNILSFPTRAVAVGEVPGPLMGDLVLALETCAREAQEQRKRPVDHFTHLVVHGVLHLLGHDHIEDREAERMEALEIRVLSDLAIDDPYSAAGEDSAAQAGELSAAAGAHPQAAG